MVDSSMKRVMIVDALNAYFRAFIVNPSLSVHGQPIGGLKGFPRHPTEALSGH